MERIRAFAARAKAYLAAHKWARIAAYVLAALLILSIVLHPHGTKTYLVLGMDNYGSLEETGRSDVIMLAQVDFTRTKINAVTFTRDMFIENEKGRLTKINTVVRNSDEQTLCDLLYQNFGVKVDGWFRVNFTSVIELVDAIGGAEVELTEEEVLYLNKHAGIYPKYPLKEGLCRLNGGQALTYARCRKLDSDFGRGERQGKLLAAMVKQTRRMTAANLVSVFGALKHAWRSSLSLPEQAGLLFKALWLRGAKLEHIGMPFENEWRYGNAGSVSGVIADLPANRALLLEALNLKDPEPEKTESK